MGWGRCLRGVSAGDEASWTLGGNKFGFLLLGVFLGASLGVGGMLVRAKAAATAAAVVVP